MTNPFRDVKTLKRSDKRCLTVWTEMEQSKKNIVIMILEAIKGEYDLKDEQKVAALRILPEFSDDEFALLCYYADMGHMPWFMEEELEDDKNTNKT